MADADAAKRLDAVTARVRAFAADAVARRCQVNGLTEAYKFSNNGSRLTHTRLSSACFILYSRSRFAQACRCRQWPMAGRSSLAAAAGGW
eukprot:scaffold123_cov106-Isochrysis_galbana.AAC.3